MSSYTPEKDQNKLKIYPIDIVERSKGRVNVHLLHTLYTSGLDSKGTPISSGLGAISYKHGKRISNSASFVSTAVSIFVLFGRFFKCNRRIQSASRLHKVGIFGVLVHCTMMLCIGIFSPVHVIRGNWHFLWLCGARFL